MPMPFNMGWNGHGSFLHSTVDMYHIFRGINWMNIQASRGWTDPHKQRFYMALFILSSPRTNVVLRPIGFRVTLPNSIWKSLATVASFFVQTWCYFSTISGQPWSNETNVAVLTSFNWIVLNGSRTLRVCTIGNWFGLPLMGIFINGGTPFSPL